MYYLNHLIDELHRPLFLYFTSLSAIHADRIFLPINPFLISLRIKNSFIEIECVRRLNDLLFFINVMIMK